MLKIVKQLLTDAKEALKRAPYSVIDKTSLPPSGNRHDYWHPAPYWWPNSDTEDGMPYVRRDGVRVPGTQMYDPESEKYDRTRLQRVFDDSLILALAWKFTGEKELAQHGVRILERFFVDPQTAMTPNLEYAQVRMGHNNNRGSSTGIIEAKDFYYYLDAVRLFEDSGYLPEDVLTAFCIWLKNYREWLVTSRQGMKECQATNNHGTYYDLQLAAIAGFLREQAVVYETLIRAQTRIAVQFAQNGAQPEELSRRTTAHYCCFNLQGWINLAQLAARWGVNLWDYETSEGASLRKASYWLLSQVGSDWPYEQIDEFDVDRFYPIWFALPEEVADEIAKVSNDKSLFPATKYHVKSLFHPHDGIRPYWNIGGSKQYTNISVHNSTLSVPKRLDFGSSADNSVSQGGSSSGNIGSRQVYRGVFNKRLLENETIIKFLAFGFPFDSEKFDDIVSAIGQVSSVDAADIEPARIRNSLYQSTMRMLQDKDLRRGISIGVTGGLDSRCLYGVVREVVGTESVFTFTDGCEGLFDYEFMITYAENMFGSNHHLLNTLDIEWDFSKEIAERKRTRHIIPISHFGARQKLQRLFFETVGAPEIMFDGFLGDHLFGGTRERDVKDKFVTDWDYAVRAFSRKNDPFKLQSYILDQYDISQFLPRQPTIQLAIDFYDALDLGLRQFQRIGEQKGLGHTNDRASGLDWQIVCPFSDPEFMALIYSLGNSSTRERVYCL